VGFLLLHAAWFREIALQVLRYVLRGWRYLFVEIPSWLWRYPGIRYFSRWLLFPALPAGIALLFAPSLAGLVIGGLLFAPTALIINSRAAEELVSDWLLMTGRQLTRRIVPGLVQYLLEFFTFFIELTERGIYRVDEALRFRTGESRFTVAVKGTLGVIWFVVS